jgi:hypothetical protein
VTIDEGAGAANNGRWSHPDGDAVTLSASLGVIVRNDDGTWAWSYSSTRGPAEGQIVTVTAADGDGGATIASFGLVVNNLPPTITLAVVPNIAVLPEPGGPVTFAVTVTSRSAASDPVSMTSLSDSVYGDLARGTPAWHGWTSSNCDLPQVIQPGQAYTCEFVAMVAGASGSVHTNMVSAIGQDDEGTAAVAAGSANVTLNSANPGINWSQCEFDMDSTLPGDQFRLLYQQQTAPTTYQLNSHNPGQFHYNALVTGQPGAPVDLVIQVPYPFVTQGARPIHAYRSYRVTTNEDGRKCFEPDNEVTNSLTISTAGGHLSSSGAPVILLGDYAAQRLDASAKVRVRGTFPTSGQLYVLIHLEYGLRKTSGWNRSGETATGRGSYKDVRILEPQSYTFTYTTGTVSHIQTAQSVNEFKQPGAVRGFVASARGEAMANVRVEIRTAMQEVLGTAYSDADGYYLSAYEHKVEAADLSIMLPDYHLQAAVTVEANGFAIADFTVETDTGASAPPPTPEEVSDQETETEAPFVESGPAEQGQNIAYLPYVANDAAGVGTFEPMVADFYLYLPQIVH